MALSWSTKKRDGGASEIVLGLLMTIGPPCWPPLIDGFYESKRRSVNESNTYVSVFGSWVINGLELRSLEASYLEGKQAHCQVQMGKKRAAHHPDFKLSKVA